MMTGSAANGTLVLLCWLVEVKNDEEESIFFIAM